MKITRIMGFLLLIVALFSTSDVYGAEKIQKDGFTISLPDGWIEIPRDAIDSYEKKMAALLPNEQVQHYDYGFQLRSAKNWLEYPYVLILVNNSGRIPKSQLEKLEGFSMEKTVDDQREKFRAVMSDIQMGKMVYDDKYKMIWMHMEFNVREVGPVSAILGMVLTENGYIQANGYCRKDDFPAHEAVFHSIATSITPDPSLAYKQKWTDSLPAAVTGIDWGKVAGRALVGAIIGGMIALILGLARKKK